MKIIIINGALIVCFENCMRFFWVGGRGFVLGEIDTELHILLAINKSVTSPYILFRSFCFPGSNGSHEKLTCVFSHFN